MLALLSAVAVFLATIPAGNYQRSYPGQSRLDEAAHYDYVIRLSHGTVPRWGQFLTYDTQRVFGCLSTVTPDPAKCHVTAKTIDQIGDPFPGTHGPEYSYEAQQTPLGYLPYVLTIQPHAPPDQALTQARWGGAIWAGLAAAAAVIYAAMVGMSSLELLAMLIMCLLGTVAVDAEFTVTNESACVFCGLLFLIVQRALDGRGLWAKTSGGIVTGAVASLVSPLAFVVPFALLVAGLVEGWPWRRQLTYFRELIARHAAELAMLAGSLCVLGGWQILQGARGSVPSEVVMNSFLQNFTAPNFQFETVTSGVNALLGLFGTYWGLTSPFYTIWNFAVVAVLVVAAFAGPGVARRARGGAIGVLAGILLLALGFPLLWFFEAHWNWNTPTRYALPLVPLIALVVVRLRSRMVVPLVGIGLPCAGLILQLVSAGAHT